MTALFRGVLTSSHSKTSRSPQQTIISRPSLVPSVKMAAGARSHHSARAIPLVLPLPVLPRDSTAHLTTCTPLLASSDSPRFWLPPPVQAPKPGSRYSYLAERTRGRGKCFRGSGPRVGVCKLASVPAGAAAATGLAQCVGAWRRRRAAG